MGYNGIKISVRQVDATKFKCGGHGVCVCECKKQPLNNLILSTKKLKIIRLTKYCCCFRVGI